MLAPRCVPCHASHPRPSPSVRPSPHPPSARLPICPSYPSPGFPTASRVRGRPDAPRSLAPPSAGPSSRWPPASSLCRPPRRRRGVSRAAPACACACPLRQAGLGSSDIVAKPRIASTLDRPPPPRTGRSAPVAAIMGSQAKDSAELIILVTGFGVICHAPQPPRSTRADVTR